ncbi:MAG: NUDIX domain-containing protein [Candidatus Aenigmarchaeota archaeon]|nr:NUDIX domain-containing protein [Candidatus Aenigmarchaeota archaeon]
MGMNKGKWKILVNATIQKENKILMGKRVDIDLWEFIGGKIEPGEQPLDTLERELIEEVSLDIECNEILTSYVTKIENEDESLNILHINYLVKSVGKPKLNKKCHSELKWFDKDELILKLTENNLDEFCLGVDKVIMELQKCQKNKK